MSYHSAIIIGYIGEGPTLLILLIPPIDAGETQVLLFVVASVLVVVGLFTISQY